MAETNLAVYRRVHFSKSGKLKQPGVFASGLTFLGDHLIQTRSTGPFGSFSSAWIVANSTPSVN
jgi:hypothetical protein